MNQCHFGGKRDSCRHFTTGSCENGLLAKTSPRNVGVLFFLESQKGLAINLQNNCVNFVGHKEKNEASLDISRIRSRPRNRI